MPSIDYELTSLTLRIEQKYQNRSKKHLYEELWSIMAYQWIYWLCFVNMTLSEMEEYVTWKSLNKKYISVIEFSILS